MNNNKEKGSAIKNKLIELETVLSNDSPSSLIKLNQQNPIRITRKMLSNLIPDLPNNEECKKFCDYIFQTNMSKTPKGIELRNLIDEKFNQIKSDETENKDDDDEIIDEIIEEALEDGIEKAVENFVEESLEEQGPSQEENSISNITTLVSHLNDKMDILTNLVKDITKNADEALQTSLMVKEKMNDHNKKIDNVSQENGNNVKKIDHLARVLEMFNKEEVEDNSSSTELRSAGGGAAKEKSATELRSAGGGAAKPTSAKPNKKSLEESANQQIRMMLGLI